MVKGNKTADYFLREETNNKFERSSFMAEKDDRYEEKLEELRSRQGFICDMDGVIYHVARKISHAGSKGFC